MGRLRHNPRRPRCKRDEMKTHVLIGTDRSGKQLVVGDPCVFTAAKKTLLGIVAANGTATIGKKPVELASVEMYALSQSARMKRRTFAPAPEAAEKK